MGSRITFQNLVDIFSKTNGLTKKASEAFMKDFFDTIIEGINNDGVVKINGFGMFKAVDVSSRESINVSNGERILIKGYKKLSFVPDEKILDLLNELNNGIKFEEVNDINQQKIPNEKVGIFSENKIADDISYNDSVNAEKDILDDIVLKEEDVERKTDEFSGIDLLISTPESIEDIRKQLNDTKQIVEKAVKEARENQQKVLRLQKLLENLENNTISVSEENYDMKEELILDAKKELSEKTECHDDKHENIKPQKKNRQKNKYFYVLLFIVLVSLTSYIIYKNCYVDNDMTYKSKELVLRKVSQNKNKSHQNNIKVDTVKQSVQTPKDSVVLNVDTIQPNKSVDKNITNENVVSEIKAVEKKEMPEYHIVKPGETLSRLSRMYYGTRDSVPAIIKMNKFPNPDNVPVGAKVKLPRFNK